MTAMDRLHLLRVRSSDPSLAMSHVTPHPLHASWAPERVTEVLAALRRSGLPVMLLATCHRLECYWWGREAQQALVSPWLATEGASAGATVERLSGEPALRHLMRVAAGLDSARRGEPEILGQVRAAWRLTEMAGTSTPPFDRTIRSVIAAARQLRRRLGFTDGAVMGETIGAATLSLVRAMAPSTTWTPRRWLVVGTGAVGTSVALALRSPTGTSAGTNASTGLGGRDVPLWLTNRTPERAGQLAQRCGGTTVPWATWRDALQQADVVIFAAHTATPLVSAADAAAIMATRTHPALWVDLGSPPNCEPVIAPGLTASGLTVPGLTMRTLADLATVGSGAPWDEATANRLLDQELARLAQAAQHRQRWTTQQNRTATPLAV